ncbi:MAG: tRNA (N(6)-L-threonylcarbamoyladenosine(37)-C(2))-methylthiotransferase MtaB [Clostridiales bacterium]|nr:tRNA (N(6)-L-threonylcarbamoyladenosine(37)-C(2))-methylthiotransferase MtaB [Clostridiales bacterium]
MIDVVVYSLGCKTNQYEGEALISEFGKMGIRASDRVQLANIYIVNTCSVTVEADRKSRQFCRRVKAINPDAFVYVCGCAVADCKTDCFAECRVIAGAMDKSKIVQYIVDNHQLSTVHSATNAPLNTTLACQSCNVCDIASRTRFVHNTTKMARKYIKIQDGCNDFCSFCIIPYLRGRSRSRHIQDIVDEIANTNVNEIVLTGINITAYGRDNNTTLHQLVDNIDTHARIRMSSIECNAITWELLDAMIRKDACNHWHLSLQSGSDRVLRAMNRKYTKLEFEDKVQLIRSMMGEDTAITTDIIVGYPTETERDFVETLDIVDRVAFADVHAFKYSPRPKTVAARLPQLASDIIDDRFERLRQRIQFNKSKFLQGQVGRQHQVVFEKTTQGQTPTGYTRNYCKVECDDALPNTMCNILATHLQGDILIGKLI